MGPSPLALAISIVCAFSQPDCRALQSMPVRQGTLLTASSYALSEYRNGAQPEIVLSNKLEHPALMSALLAHEAMNARLAPRPPRNYTRAECVASETAATKEQLDEWSWFVQTFGPPVVDAHTFLTIEWPIAIFPNSKGAESMGVWLCDLQGYR